MNSRWSTLPITRDGEIVSIRPNTPGDVKILKTFGRYGNLDAKTIAALTGRSYRAIIARLNLLKRHPNKLIKVHDTQLEQPRLFQWAPQVFQLTPAGRLYLKEIGFEPTPKPAAHFIHSITEAQTAASFEIGARLKNLEHVTLDQTPIPVAFSYRGKNYEYDLTPDYGPIGIGYGNDMHRFMVGEVDLASEPLESSNRDRQAIELKFKAYLTVLENRLYEKTWGIPNCLVCFTTTSQTRLDNMRKLLSDMSRKHLNCFLFQVRPTILSSSPKPPQGSAVTCDWLTGNGRINIGEVSGQTRTTT